MQCCDREAEATGGVENMEQISEQCNWELHTY